MACVPSKDSDQPGHQPSLIRVFAGHTCHFVGFVMRWLTCPVKILQVGAPKVNAIIILKCEQCGFACSNESRGCRQNCKSTDPDYEPRH